MQPVAYVEENKPMDRDPENTAPDPVEPAVNDWPRLVARIKSGDPDGMADLYALFTRGIRFYFYRQLGPDELEDKLHDTFLIVVQAIQRGDIREPERLMGFVRTVVRRQVAGHIDTMVHRRHDQAPLDSSTPVADARRSPEEMLAGQEKMDLVVKTLRSLATRDREILTRFYLQEQTQEQICREMKLTPTQFRLLKSRAKDRFGNMGRRRLEHKNTLRAF